MLLILEPLREKTLCQLAVLVTEKVWFCVCVQYYSEIRLVKYWYGVLCWVLVSHSEQLGSAHIAWTSYCHLRSDWKMCNNRSDWGVLNRQSPKNWRIEGNLEKKTKPNQHFSVKLLARSLDGQDRSKHWSWNVLSQGMSKAFRTLLDICIYYLLKFRGFFFQAGWRLENWLNFSF